MKNTKMITVVLVFIAFIIGYFVGDSTAIKRVNKQIDTKVANQEIYTKHKQNKDIKELNGSRDKNKPIEKKKDRKSEIEACIKDTFNNGDYTSTKFNSITVNENLGTNVPDEYIALVYLKFDIKNSRKTGNQVMKMYSNDLVAKLASCSGISEISVFWEDQYNNRTVKYAYKHKNDGFSIMNITGE